MKALFTYDYGKDKMEKIKDIGYDIKIMRENDFPNYESIADTEVLVCYNPFNTLDINKLNNLKWIQLSSIGIDQLPINKLQGRDILITNNRGGYSIPMGEWIVLKILELIKHSTQLYRNQQNKIWKIDTGLLELYNKKIIFIGTGTIAFEAAKRLQGFECRIDGINTNGRKVQYFDKCYPIESLKDIISDYDIVVTAIPSTNNTCHLINKDIIERMKKGVYFINISRGNILDEKELTENLLNKRIGGAALDVFEEEPLNRDNILWELDNVIVTPHNSWISERRNERRFEIIYENMRRYIKGEVLKNIVDIAKGY